MIDITKTAAVFFYSPFYKIQNLEINTQFITHFWINVWILYL